MSASLEGYNQQAGEEVVEGEGHHLLPEGEEEGHHLLPEGEVEGDHLLPEGEEECLLPLGVEAEHSLL